jgi:hypothetical protein
MVRAAGANRSAAEHSNGISPGETRAAVANKLFLVSPTIRAATESAAFAFALSALATFVLSAYVFSVHAGDSVTRSAVLGLISFATVFLTVLVTVRSRLARKKPVLGTKRGAVIAMMAVVVVAFAHTCLTFGSAGFTYSLFCQVGYACLVGGGPAAIAGAILGRSIEYRVFIARGS